MKKYVLGFCFSKDHSHVAIMKKNRPDAQAGLHNGLGGKVEEDEKPKHTMAREFEEESGVHIMANNWQQVDIKTDNETFYIDVFYTRSDLVYQCRTIENEEVIVAELSKLSEYEFYDGADEMIIKFHKNFY